MSRDVAIESSALGKMYKLYRRPSDKVMEAFGLSRILFWRKNTYKPFWALRDVNLQVPKGERLGIIGRNGAGKSTFLKIVTGNIAPTEGTVRVSGRIQALMELGTGFHPEFTGRENIRASLGYQGLGQARIRQLEEEIVDFAELEEFIDQPIKTYSAGMYARLAFSTATAIEPEILIIDEVLGAGDAYFAGKCVERMKKLTDNSGATVLFVSHDLASVQALCDRVVWLQRGQIKADGGPLQVIKQYISVVRQEESARLKARDLRVSKKRAVVLDSLKDIFDSVLCRLVTGSGDHPKGQHKVRQLVLKIDGAEAACIDVGAPMDNSPDLQQHVMDEPTYMDWGQPSSDSRGYYRLYADFRGRYRHAPFEFSVPKSHIRAGAEIVLEITAECAKDDEVFAEVYSPVLKEYRRLGHLNSGHNTNQFGIGAELLNSDLSPQEPAKTPNAGLDSIDHYGSLEAHITGVTLLDPRGIESKTLQCLEPCRVSIKYQTQGQIVNPTFVFCIYTASGMTASQWLVSTKDIGHPSIDGTGELVFDVDRLLLGRGSYVASAAMFKWFPSSGTEPEAYHVLDRCIHFQVVDGDPTDRLDYGICRQPVSAELITRGREV